MAKDWTGAKSWAWSPSSEPGAAATLFRESHGIGKDLELTLLGDGRVLVGRIKAGENAADNAEQVFGQREWIAEPGLVRAVSARVCMVPLDRRVGLLRSNTLIFYDETSGRVLAQALNAPVSPAELSPWLLTDADLRYLADPPVGEPWPLSVLIAGDEANERESEMAPWGW